MSTKAQLQIAVNNITWDTDTDDGAVPYLPNEVNLVMLMSYDYTQEELIESINDALSDHYDFLVQAYDYTITKTTLHNEPLSL